MSVAAVDSVVVLDRGDAEWVAGYLYDAADKHAAVRRFVDAVKAQTKPPKPDEPTGLGAVVEDAEGEQWVRSRHEAHQWIPALRGRGLVFCAWDEIDAVRILSEGVTA